MSRDTTTRMLHLIVDPALRAYFAWVDEDRRRQFIHHDYDMFAAGYRRRSDELNPPLLDVAPSGDGAGA